MIPLLVATLEGETEEIYPLGRSFVGRMARKTKNVAKAPAKAVAKVASSQVRNVAHGVARVGRATGRVGMQVKRGNIKGAFSDLGRLVTTVATAPATIATGAVSKKAGRALEGVIKRNDPMALLHRKIFEAVKTAIRPVVSKFSGEEFDGFGADDMASKLQGQRAAIIAASVAAGTAAGAAIGGPVGAPIGAALVPAAVDALIKEFAGKVSAAVSSEAGEMPTESGIQPLTIDAAPIAEKKPIALYVGLGVLAVGAVMLARKK